MRRPRPRICHARGCTPPICADIRPWRPATARSPPGARQPRLSLRALTRAAAPRAHTRNTYGANGAAFRLQSLPERTSREVVQAEKTRRVTPENLLFIGCGDYQSVHDVEVLPGIDRHRAVIGAEHDAIDAEHLHRLAHVRRPEAHGVDVKLGEIIARLLLAANDGALRHALAAEPPTEIEPSDDRQKSAAHMGDRDLQVRIAVEQPRQDHACERHRGVERPPDQFIEFVLIHLLVVSDRYARRMNEERHLPRLRPFPERKGGFAVDELAVPARRDQQSLEAERSKTALALRDVACIERIERAEAPVALRPRHHRGGLVVDVLDDVDRGLARDRAHHLRRKRIADDPAGDAGPRAKLLLEVEIRHVVVGHRRQTAVIRDRILADRYSPQRLRDAEWIVARWG